jgi:hypothetical protein
MLFDYQLKVDIIYHQLELVTMERADCLPLQIIEVAFIFVDPIMVLECERVAV